MTSIRTGRILAATIAALLLLAVAASAADAPGPSGTLTGSISPNHLTRHTKGKVGTPIALKIGTTFKQPSDTSWVLTKVVYKFPNGAVANGKLFPSCSVAQLKKAHNNLRACPKGSKIGGGVAAGTAPEIGVSSTGKMTLFNGPHGKSVTLNISIVQPAQINSTFSAPLKKTRGKYSYTLTVKVPSQLQSILGGPIVVTKINAKTFATRMVKGVKRGFIEGLKCPKSGKVPFHGEFSFKDANSSATTNVTSDTTIKCKR